MKTRWLLFFVISSLQGTAGQDPIIRKAEAAFQARDFQGAISLGLEALKKYAPESSPEQYVEVQNLLGSAYTYTRAYEKARASLDAAITVTSERLEPGHPLSGHSHYHLGVLLDRTGHPSESVAHHLKGLAILVKNYGEDHLIVSECYIGLGEVYLYSMMSYRKALAYFQRSANIREQHLPEDHLDLYIAYFYLSQANRRLGDYDKALTFAFKALSVIGARKEYAAYLERCHTLLGDIYYSLTDFPTSIRYLSSGIDHSVRLRGSDNYDLIKKYLNLGVAYSESGESRKAIAMFRKSLAIYGLHHHHNAELKGQNFLHLGRTYQRMGVPDSAHLYLKQYLKIVITDHGSYHSATSEAYRYLARYFSGVGDVDSAMVYINKSLRSALPHGMRSRGQLNLVGPERDNLFQIFADKGAILLKKFNSEPGNLLRLDSSLQCYQVADTLLQLKRATYQEEGSKLFMADHYHAIYENALAAANLIFQKTADERYLRAALSFMEKSKALLLADALARAEIFSLARLPDSLRDMDRAINRAIATYRNQLEEARHQSDQVKQGIQSRIYEIGRRRQQLIDTIARRYPAYFSIRYQELSSVDEVRRYASERDAAILEYFWGAGKVFAILMGGNEVRFAEITGVDSLSRDIEAYFSLLNNVTGWNGSDSGYERFLASGRRLYRKLVQPFVDGIPEDNLIIIRDGPLHNIPFESLPVSEPRVASGSFKDLDYMLYHRVISYAHSADLLVKDSYLSVPKKAENRVLAFSFSSLTSPDDPRVSNRNKGELPGAASEITSISRAFPGTFLLGEDATEKKFKAMAGDFDILHLALHGKNDPEKQFSGSLYFKREKDDADDGELHVYELYDLALKARLAVLSACESGSGRIYRGEGVFSIARGFAYAGCPSTVMSLWPVGDQSSAKIMAAFYNGLSAGKPIDEALRDAKRNYLQNSDPLLTHPGYWAAFIPTGSMQPVSPPPPDTMRWAVAVSVLILTGIALAFVRRRRKSRQHHSNMAPSTHA